MFIQKSICPVYMVKFLYDLGFLGPKMYGYATVSYNQMLDQGAQWLIGRVLDSRPRGRGFEPHRRHCVVVLEQGTFILA